MFVREYVEIKNNCGALNVKDWKIKDESRKIFTFPSISLENLVVYSGSGENSRTNLFWNSKAEIWNNDRDTIYIFDKDWRIVYHESYGY